MLNHSLQETNNEQIKNEFRSADMYLSRSSWFEDKGTSGSAKWMRCSARKNWRTVTARISGFKPGTSPVKIEFHIYFRFSSARARSNTASNIRAVSRPVLVFCRLG